jgi:Zn finger protein HypA/HybF involved in hydrogenase expression
VGSLNGRISRLEEVAGDGGGCPRCSGTTVIIVNGKVESVNKGGQKLTPEEAQEFVGEERDGRCPVCGQKRQEVTVGGWGK